MASKIPGWQDGEFGHKLGELITYIVENIKQTIEDDKEVCKLAFSGRVRLINVRHLLAPKSVHKRRHSLSEQGELAFQLCYMSQCP